MKLFMHAALSGLALLGFATVPDSLAQNDTLAAQQPSFGVFMPAPTVLSTTSVALTAWVTYSTPNIQQITWAFEYGLTALLGTTTPEETRLTTDGNTVATITNLIPNTNYFCRARARNASGEIVYSQVQTFTNVSPPIGRITVANVTTNSAVIEIGVTPNGTNPVRVQVSIGPGIGAFLGPFTLSGTNESVISGTISNLQPTETYDCLLYMESLAGTHFASKSFTTLPFQPVVGICTVTNLRAMRAETRCFVHPNRDYTAVWFEWGTTTSYGQRSENASISRPHHKLRIRLLQHQLHRRG